MSVNRDKIVNRPKKARKDPRTDQATLHYEPTFEQIKIRAYEIYIQRGRQDGLDLDDWFQYEPFMRAGCISLTYCWVERSFWSSLAQLRW